MWLSSGNHICLTFPRKEEVSGTFPGVHAEPDSHVLNFIEQVHVKTPSFSISETLVSRQHVVAMEFVGKRRGTIPVQRGKTALNNAVQHEGKQSSSPLHCFSPLLTEQSVLEHKG